MVYYEVLLLGRSPNQADVDVDIEAAISTEIPWDSGINGPLLLHNAYPVHSNV